jgi:hypothetical protein
LADCSEFPRRTIEANSLHPLLSGGASYAIPPVLTGTSAFFAGPVITVTAVVLLRAGEGPIMLDEAKASRDASINIRSTLES